MFSKSPFGDFVHSLSSLFKQRLAPGEGPAQDAQFKHRFWNI